MRVLAGLVVMALVSLSARAGNLETSFEFEDTTGNFRLGEGEFYAQFRAGEARKPADPGLVRTGQYSWVISPGRTGVIHIPNAPTRVRFSFRDAVGSSAQSEIRIYRPDGSLAQTFKALTQWLTVSIGSQSGFSRIEFENTDPSALAVMDDFSVVFARVDLYCEPKVNSCGTEAFIGAKITGGPSADGSGRFAIFGRRASADASGLLMYTAAGPASIPFQGGTLCVSAPIHRSVPVQSGSEPNCQASFEIEWNAFVAGKLGGNPAPFLRVVGQEVHLQWYGRDTAAHGPYLTGGLAYRVCP